MTYRLNGEKEIFMAKLVIGNNGVAYRLHEGFTHGGVVFHADDVFSAAFLKILNPEIEISRGFKIPENFDGIIFDMGGGEFDHHYEGAPVREDGTPYSSFGLLWERFGRSLFKTELSFKKIEENIVIPVDKTDCTGVMNPLSYMISGFNKDWDDNQSPDELFFEAVEMAKSMLERSIKKCQSTENAHDGVQEAFKASRNGIIVLDKFMPWGELIQEESPRFVVYPGAQGGWNAQVVPINNTTKDARVDFPIEWRGQKNFTDSKGRDIVFCHMTGFLVNVKDKETAIEICKEAIDATK